MKVISIFLDVMKSFLFCKKCFGVKIALKLPVIISHRVEVIGAYRGAIYLEGPIRFGMVRLGISDGAYHRGKDKKSYLSFAEGSRIVVQGRVHIANDFAINMCKGGQLILGDNFASNYGLIISCEKKIQFARDCLIGWSNTFIDGDGHDLFDENGKLSNEPQEISVGKHSWLAAQVTYLKGAKTAANTIVGFNSTVSKEFTETNVLLAGTPARIVKQNIIWKH